MYLADTTFIIDLINSDTGAVEKAQEIDENKLQASLSSISVEEYLRGVFYLFGADQEVLERKLVDAETDLARFDIIDFTYTLARVAAEIDGQLVRAGKMIGFADVLIGATAQFHKLRLLTRNVDHFSRIENLDIESY
jgi:predicted nucleic acid-binding protein